MKICPECGQTNLEGKFCKKCGHVFIVEPPKPIEVEPVDRKKSDRWLIGYALILLAALAVGAIAIFLLYATRVIYRQ